MLLQSICEMERGLVGVDLGGYVYKKRIAINGQGKRGGARSIVAFKAAGKAFFIFGYKKNAIANIKKYELKVAKKLSVELFSYTAIQLGKLVEKGVLLEVKHNG